MERLMYSHDFASLPKIALLQWKMIPDFVAIPKTVEEVSRLVQFSYEAGIPIVPRGGGTGLVGGAVPNRGGILLDLRRMDRVEAIDPERRTVSVQAGRPSSYSFKDLGAAKDAPAAIAGSDHEPYNASFLDPMHLAFVKAVRPDAPDPQALANIVFEGPKDEVTTSEKEMDGLIAGL